MKRILFAIVIVLSSISTIHAQSGSENILFILDGSGSMWGEVQGDKKISIAKSVMVGLVKKLPKNVNIGLQVYGHRRKGDCSDIELLSPLETKNRQSLIRNIRSITPKGKTPITQSIEQAAEHLRIREEKSTIILVSDGKETCRRDPCATVRKLKKLGLNFKVHVVGFDVNREERRELQCIAHEGGGLYISADNAEQLQNALTEVKEQVTQSKKQPGKKGERRYVRGDCKTPRKRWNSTRANGVFVGADEGCAWSYGYQTIREAESAALNLCRKSFSNCRIVARNSIDEYSLTSRCKSRLKYWRGLSANGAFAVTQNGDCAYNAGRETIEDAVAEVLKSCRSARVRCKIIERKSSKNWKLSAECSRDFERWKQRDANAVFVASINGSCAYTSGYSTIEQARKRALDLCRERYKSCKVIKTIESQAWQLSDKCKRDLTHWKRNRPNGAFAVTRNGQCSYNYGFETIQKAESQVMRACQSNGHQCKIIERITVKEWQISESCKRKLENWRGSTANAVFAITRNGQCTYNTGRETIEEARQQIRNACRNQSSGCRIVEEIKSVDWQPSPKCQRNLQSWKGRKGNSAFAISINGNCAYTSGYSTIEKAREKALNLCRNQYRSCKILEEKTLEQKKSSGGGCKPGGGFGAFAKTLKCKMEEAGETLKGN